MVINARECNVSKAGKLLELTPKEFDVLEYFVKHPNQTVAVESLLRRVWSFDSDATEQLSMCALIDYADALILAKVIPSSELYAGFAMYFQSNLSNR